MQDRRSDYDVTNTVQVSSPEAVCEAVQDLFVATYPDGSFRAVERAFQDFERLFNGNWPGYLGCDTVYHDIQHTLDITLAMARLLSGHDRSEPPEKQLGADRAVVGLITSLFHDSGYIRQADDQQHQNGADFTLYHVTRGAHFLRRYLPTIGWGDAASVACQIVHFTGYEVNIEHIDIADPRDRKTGHLLGTADLIAQMADRCYLEKCRDRLYPEFVLGGLAVKNDSEGHTEVRFESGMDLLRKTPTFFEEVTRKRLEGSFQKAYRYLEVLYDGENPYMKAIERNLAYLEEILANEHWQMLRREPPCFTWEKGVLGSMDQLVGERLRRMSRIS